MTEWSFTLPDIGEGIAEAELSDWRVKPGDVVREDDILCEVTTDKAVVEIPASASGRITWIAGPAGDMLAIGAELVRIEVDGSAPPPEPAVAEMATAPTAAPKPRGASVSGQARLVARGGDGRPLAAPSVRGRAREEGVDLRQLRGSGPAGRILQADLDAFLSGAATAPDRARQRTGTEEIKVVGIRRRIAEKMTLSKARIPHFSIIEEIDVEALEALRERLNRTQGAEQGKLTLLPFVLRALVRALAAHPAINATFDDEAGIVTRHRALHCGIATQTDAGLMVPVLRHTEALDLWQTARAIRELAEASRAQKAAPADLSGSTLTVTSLGPLGAVATTPIINHPEVAIVGINKIAVRPVWDGGTFVPRRMMNLSCSFDHRVVDGWAAATFVARLKELLEVPTLIFMEGGVDE
ncbi:MAG: 2-oxo acid dehydrogenase subunit E2 [Rhodobacteraceae bacterium]|nr:2-oxo acid dehydrogenase subunit E2 [Paracoccaceae bacterium]